MESSGPSDHRSFPPDDVNATKGHRSSTRRYMLELVDKMPDNPKRLVFESTQQRYEVPLRQDESLNSSVGTRSTLSPQNTGANETPAARRRVDRIPSKLKKVVFESSQEWFAHHIGQEHSAAVNDRIPAHSCPAASPTGMPNSPAGSRSPQNRIVPDVCSDDDDFIPFPSTRFSPHIVKSKNIGLRNSRQTRSCLSTGDGIQARQRKKRAINRSSIVNVRCNPADVIATSQLLTSDQFAAIEDDGFGHFLRLEIDALDNKNLLCWLLHHTDPNSMQIKIGPGKVLPITPHIISIVLGLPLGGENLKLYSWKEGVIFRQQLTRDLNQDLPEDCDIHITNLQQEILMGNVNPLMKRCFFTILCNRLLLPTSSNTIGSVDIKRTMDPQLFGVVDRSQAVFNDLQLAVRTWHDRDKNNLTQTIYGCAIFLIVYYLDNIDHPRSPVDRTSTPRITLFDTALLQRLTVADTIETSAGARTFGFLPFKSWNTTCYATADVRSVPLQPSSVASPVMPHFDIPRLQDLLSQPIDGLTGTRKERVQGFFAQFDDTLSQNTRSIEQSFGNIARAQTKLADQCRPILQELVASQSGDNNIPGVTSSTLHTHSDRYTHNHVLRTPPSSPGQDIYRHCSFVSAKTLLSRQIPDHATACHTPGPSSLNPTPPTGPFGSPVHGHPSMNTSVCDGPNLFVSSETPLQTPPIAPLSNATTEEGIPNTSTEACGQQNPSLISPINPSTHRQSNTVDRAIDAKSDAHVDTSTSAKIIPLGHDSSAKDQFFQKVPLFHSDLSNHPPGLSPVVCNPSASASPLPCCLHTAPPGSNAGESCNPTFGEDNTYVFKKQILDDVPLLKLPGKRLTKKPFKFCSPFKLGILSRPPPVLDLSLRMHSFLCADDSPLKRITLMHFGSQSLTGQDIAMSFADGKFIDSVFMAGFIKCT